MENSQELWNLRLSARFSEALEMASKGVTVVTPNRRLARVLTAAYGEQRMAGGAAAWESPRIVTWNGWLDQLWRDWFWTRPVPLRRLSGPAEAVLWEEIVGRNPAQNLLLDASATAAEVRNAWQLATEWALEREAIAAAATEESAALTGWFEEFETRTREMGMVDDARLAGLLCAHSNELSIPGPVCLAGFEELTPQQEFFIEAVRKRRQVTRLAARPAAPAVATVRIACASPTDELRAASAWAREQLLVDSSALIAVVAGDLQSRRAEVTRTFDEAFDQESLVTGERRGAYNVAGGESLTTVPLVRSASAVLDAARRDARIETVAAILLDPFLGGADAERSARAASEAKLRRSAGRPLQDSAAFAFLSRELERCPQFASRFRRMRQTASAWNDRKRPSEWAAGFTALLADAGWPGDRGLNSTELQAVQAWRETLEEFAKLDDSTGSVPFGAALGWLRRIAAEASFQPEGSEAPVQVLGAFEASHLAFDAIWVCGMTDQAWPAPPRPNPFLPLPLQRERGVTHASAAQELAFARRLFEQLVGAAPQAIFSHALRSGNEDLLPSPFLREIPEGAAASAEVAPYAAAVFAVRRLERMLDVQGPPLECAGTAPGGSDLLKQQAACPFRAFGTYRLGAKPFDKAEPGIDDRERGSLIHEALASFWRRTQTSGDLAELSEADLREAIHAAIEDGIAKVRRNLTGIVSEAVWRVERARLSELLQRWMEVEKGRGGFRVLASEENRQLAIGGLELSVRLDRVDELPDGSHVLIDYKSGNAMVSAWDAPRPDEPQLPLYACGHEARVAGVAFGVLRARAVELRGIGTVAAGFSKPIDMEAQLSEWRVALDALAADFRSGDARVDPKSLSKTCTYCDLPALCRIGDSVLNLGDDDDAEE